MNPNNDFRARARFAMVGGVPVADRNMLGRSHISKCRPDADNILGCNNSQRDKEESE